MEEFIEKVKQTTLSVAAVSAREGKKLYSITKLSLEMAEEKSKIKALYKEIGVDAYKAHKEKKNIEKRIRAKLERIDELEAKVAVLRKKIEVIKAYDALDEDDYYDVDDTSWDDELFSEDSYAEEENDETSDDDDEELETEPID